MGKIQYFKDCKDENEGKALYRKLSIKNHPDKGGDVTVMQDINTQYASFLKGKNYNFSNFKFDHSDIASLFHDIVSIFVDDKALANTIHDLFTEILQHYSKNGR